MAVIKNEDIEILKDIELYLYNINRESYVEQNGLFAIRRADIKDEKALELYFKLYAIIEENNQKRKKLNEKSTEYNKKNKKYHNISNNLCQARKSKNTKRIEYWENEMKLFKEKQKKKTKENSFMAKIYLNEQDIKVLERLKEVASDEEKIVITGILTRNEKNRKHFNKVASDYKREMRKTNKCFARSKKEIKESE